MHTERYDIVLGAAGDITSAPTAFDAELLVSTLLGTVYAMAPGDRAHAAEAFAAGLRDHLTDRRTPDAVALGATLDALTAPGRAAPAGTRAASGEVPRWLPQVGRVRPTGTYASGDGYGDQVSYVATFAYLDPESGGPDHAVVVLVDHNLGFARDVVVTAQVDVVLREMSAAAEDDPAGWFVPVEPADLREATRRYLGFTDGLRDLPTDESLATDRALALARLALLPPPEAESPGRPAAGTAELVAEFRASREGRRLARAPRESLDYCLELVTRFTEGAEDRDPLRWSPTTVDLFLLDWVPRSALLDADDTALLPTVLTAWITWAGRRKGLPAAAVARTVATVAELRAKFADMTLSGEHRSAAAVAVDRMLAEGVDPADEQAVTAWLERHEADPGDGGGSGDGDAR